MGAALWPGLALGRAVRYYALAALTQSDCTHYGAHHAVAALAHASDDEVVVQGEVQLRRSAEVALGLALALGLGLGLGLVFRVRVRVRVT